MAAKSYHYSKYYIVDSAEGCGLSLISTTHCVITQKSTVLIYLMAEAWNHASLIVIRFIIPVMFNKLIRVECLSLSNTTLFYLMIEVYLHYYLVM